MPRLTYGDIQSTGQMQQPTLVREVNDRLQAIKRAFNQVHEYSGTDELIVPASAFQAVSAGRDTHASLWDAIAFDDTSDEVASASIGTPYLWNAGSVTAVKLWFSTVSANTSDAVRWQVSVLSASSGDSISSATETQTEDVTVEDTANLMNVATITLGSAVSFTRGDFVALEVSRIGSHANDTASGDADLLAAALVYEAT